MVASVPAAFRQPQLHCDSGSGGYPPIKLNGLDPGAYLRVVLAESPITLSKLTEQLPWCSKPIEAIVRAA